MNFKKTWMKSLKKTILDSFFETELKVISTEWMTDFFCWRYINHKKLTFVLKIFFQKLKKKKKQLNR